jgi:hypothetical protein
MVSFAGTILLIIGLLLGIVSLSVSTFILGKEDFNRWSTAYQIAIAFLIIGLLLIIGTIIGLITIIF